MVAPNMNSPHSLVENPSTVHHEAENDCTQEVKVTSDMDIENQSSCLHQGREKDVIVDTDDDDDDDYKQQCCGRIANAIIRVTEGMLWTPLAVLWILLVIVSGAIFFFFMVGLDLNDDEKEEKWLNYSIQVLNVLFTYAAVANEPKRLRDFIRLWRVRGTAGVDWRGKTSTKIFDYIPYRDRMFIIVNLNLNCIFQYINQTFRIIYFTPQKAAEHVLEVNLFFALSFLCAIIAPIHQYRMEQRVRREGRAPPGQELDPIQKFIGRVDWSYRDLAIESYQFAMYELKKRMASEREEEMKKNCGMDKDDSKTDRTAPESHTSLQYKMENSKREGDNVIGNESEGDEREM